MSFNILFLCLFAFVSVVFLLILQKYSFKYWALLLSSLLFYGFLVQEMLLVLMLFSVLMYYGAIWIEKSKKANIPLLVTIGIGLLPLLFFKYYAVVSGQFNASIYFVGLSFFTFNGISYLMDVKRGYLKPEKNYPLLLLYICFLPHILSGPLHRANFLLKQFREQITLSNAHFSGGFRLILWGVFKNYVLAERLDFVVDGLIDYPETYTGWYVWLAGLLFFFQIYCDFSSYVDISQGMAQLFGIKLKANFKDRVYLSSSRAKFWSGWHITLNHWFRDYFFFPLAKGCTQKWKLNAITLLTFTLIGVWHGATISFLLWGLINGLWVITERVLKPYFNFIPSSFKNILGVLYHWFIAAWVAVVFRTNSLSESMQALFAAPKVAPTAQDSFNMIKHFVILVPTFLFMDFMYRKAKNKRIDVFIGEQKMLVRWALYFVIIFLILSFGYPHNQGYYYFKF